MYRWIFGALSIAACYAPLAPVGVPCTSSAQACPENQACVAGFCVVGSGTGVDAAPGDGIGAGDRDGDGVPDAMDNCPDVKNPDQGNEDGDRFGDACDPCPPVADNAPKDSDGDGVADACDPNPQTPGDRIELFEGFHHGLPSWARSTSWAAAADAVRVTAARDSVEFLVPPTTSPDHITLSASVVIESVIDGTDDAIEVVAPEDVSSDSGLDCELYQPPSGSGGRHLALFDDFDLGEFASQPWAWSNNTAYTLALTHVGQSYRCTATEPAGTSHTVTGTSRSTVSSPPSAVVRAYSLTARVNWVMVVRSP